MDVFIDEPIAFQDLLARSIIKDLDGLSVHVASIPDLIAGPLEYSFDDVEHAQLMAWMRLSAGAKIDFFEEMVEIAYRSGALQPDRLALRDAKDPRE